jgi:hypothetical protein
VNSTALYFKELSDRLRQGGVPADRASDMIDDLSAYLAESGTDPHDEFGSAESFAAQLLADAPTPSRSAPDPSDERWTFHADAFNEMDLLREFGDQGWEVVSYDLATGYDCRRSLENPQRWEYRREIVSRNFDSVAERLAEDGWEPAATYMFWRYFKRPVAATTGPAAALEAPPVSPSRRTYWSPQFRRLLIALLALLAVVIATFSLAVSEPGSALSTVAGAFTGMAVVGLTAAAIITYQRRKTRRTPGGTARTE